MRLYCVKTLTNHWHLLAENPESAVTEVLNDNPSLEWQFPRNLEGVDMDLAIKEHVKEIVLPGYKIVPA